MKTVIFDLDGTISNPAEGITKSLNHSIVALGHDAIPEKALLKYIGPPLPVIFGELLKTRDDTLLSRAVELYRERYFTIGYRENFLYEGVKDVLSELHRQGYALCIATSKRRDIAVKVIKYLGVDAFFTEVLGCDLHRTKTDLLLEILCDADPRSIVMIGDRESDFQAASKVKIPSIAVTWGFGNTKELEKATVVTEDPSDLQEAIVKLLSCPL